MNIVVPNETDTFQILAGTKTLTLREREMSDVAVKISGNEIVAHNYEMPLVEVGRLGSVNGSIVSFTNNYCMGEPRDENVQSAIVLRGFAAVISQNSIWTSEPINSMMIFVDSKFTAIGNITTGAIQINGRLLDDPWKQLNVIGS